MGESSYGVGPSVAVRRGALVALVVAFLSLLPAPALAAAGCETEAGWANPHTAWAEEVLALTNAHRVALGLAPLARSATLTTAAEWKASHMATYRYMSHDDPAPDARAWDQRIRDCGYTYGAGENIAFGYPSPAGVIRAWLASPGHRANIENPSYKVMGVGAALTSGGTPYWAQIFGLRVDGTETALPVEDVEPANTAPVAEPDLAATHPRLEISLNVLSNDVDPDGDDLALEALIKEPSFGRASFDPASGSITYRARRGTAGEVERIAYRVSDGVGGFDRASVRIRIRRG